MKKLLASLCLAALSLAPIAARADIEPATYTVLNSTAVTTIKYGPGIFFGAGALGVETQPLNCWDSVSSAAASTGTITLGNAAGNPAGGGDQFIISINGLTPTVYTTVLADQTPATFATHIAGAINTAFSAIVTATAGAVNVTLATVGTGPATQYAVVVGIGTHTGTATISSLPALVNATPTGAILANATLTNGSPGYGLFTAPAGGIAFKTGLTCQVPTAIVATVNVYWV